MSSDSLQAGNDLSQKHWAIIGGGMLGLTLAHNLAKAGQQVTLYEAASEIGGLAGSWHVGEIQWDKHYHVTLLSDLRNRALLTELGLEKDMRWVETKTGFFTEGKLYSMSSTPEFLRFPPLRMIDKIRLGGTIFMASKRRDWQALERIPVADWLSKWSGRRTFEKIWLPLLKAKLGDTYKRCSATFIWATIARMYKARQSGLKKEMFGYVPGGYAKILEHFAASLATRGVEICTGEPIKQIVSDQEGLVSVQTDQGAQHFDRVVMTTPSSLLTNFCPQLSDHQRQQHEQVEYLGILCASVVLKKPLANYYVTNITDSGVPFTAVIEMTTLVDPKELGGNTLVYLPRYAAHDDKAWEWSDAQIEELFIGALVDMYPDFSRDDVLAFKVSRARHVMALPTLEYSTKLPPMETNIPNVFAVNSAHIVKGTLNVNEVVELAETALSETLLPSLQNAYQSSSALPELPTTDSLLEPTTQPVSA
ncbi:NAD(P)/FAD-dependent oxidoreductase [Adhaeretor mobilis]|uniref:Protoporphyrinogen oxidase n=1 Tax=Adhaeretor mobilis TaxID=1930276 RepID=A0A517MVV1_9BACT|nr:NAD(P)/FAD-dependent oxidoreductase [Adhaeretor mobilis]QDS99006.1 Protoporphyrinogen oxidase [Adhaeretor mobilis]